MAFTNFANLMAIWSAGDEVAQSRYLAFVSLAQWTTSPYESRVLSMTRRARHSDQWRSLLEHNLDVPSELTPMGSGSNVDPAVTAAVDTALAQLRRDANVAAGMTKHSEERARYVQQLQETQVVLFGSGNDGSGSRQQHQLLPHAVPVVEYAAFAEYGADWLSTAEVAALKQAPAVEALLGGADGEAGARDTGDAGSEGNAGGEGGEGAAAAAAAAAADSLTLNGS